MSDHFLESRPRTAWNHPRRSWEMRASESDAERCWRNQFLPFSCWGLCVRWLLGYVELLCCTVPIAQWFVIIFPRGGLLYCILGRGLCILFGRLIPWDILPKATYLSGSLLSLLVILGWLSQCTISACSWLHFWGSFDCLPVHQVLVFLVEGNYFVPPS